MMITHNWIRLDWIRLGVLAGAFSLLYGQAVEPPAVTSPPASQDNSQLRSTYVLGPEDLIVIRALEAEEINDKPVRIDMSGNIRLPLVGRVHAAGLTVEQLESEVTAHLNTYIKQPQVAISITEFRSQPVSILGAVALPGVHQLQGKKTLVEMLSIAGGVKEDSGPIIKITRRMQWGRIPLANAKDDPSGQVSVAEVNIKGIMDAKNPLENILIRPDDVITVPRADVVYVIGEVQKPGGYTLRERESLSVLQVLSMAGGMSRVASAKNAKILRIVAGNKERNEIPVDLKKILEGHGNDVALLPEDILFVPNNVSKNVAMRGLESAIAIGTGLAIYRR